MDIYKRLPLDIQDHILKLLFKNHIYYTNKCIKTIPLIYTIITKRKLYSNFTMKSILYNNQNINIPVCNRIFKPSNIKNTELYIVYKYNTNHRYNKHYNI